MNVPRHVLSFEVAILKQLMMPQMKEIGIIFFALSFCYGQHPFETFEGRHSGDVAKRAVWRW